jgi:hypothetical protein
MATIPKDYGTGGSGLNPAPGTASTNGSKRHPPLGKVLRDIATDLSEVQTAVRSSGLILHGARTAAVTTPDASGAGGALTTAQVTLANALKAAFNAHGALGAPTHLAADAANVVATANASDEASAITLANEIKADFNLHVVSGTYHTVGGAGGAAAPAVIATADASNTATLTALLNATKAAMNRHFASGFAVTTIAG